MNHLCQTVPNWPFPLYVPPQKEPMKPLYNTLVYTFDTYIDTFHVTGEARLEEFPDQPPFIWIDEVYLDNKLLSKTMISDWLEKYLEEHLYKQWVNEALVEKE